MFNDRELSAELNEAGFQFSSANSINIGRLVPQIVYYVYAYSRLVGNGTVKAGEKINVVVPTGNFGNILAAYYAKQMGLPINKLICASNENKVLFDFFRTGTYDRKRFYSDNFSIHGYSDFQQSRNVTNLSSYWRRCTEMCRTDAGFK